MSQWRVHGDDVAKAVFRLLMDTLKFTAMPFGLTNAPAVFIELMSRSQREMIVESLKDEKMYVKFSNNIEAEHRGSYLDMERIKWVSRWMKLFSEYGFKAKYHLGKENVVVESWSRKKSEAKNEFWIDV
ncbi:hypothetical protein Tco_1492952 [Tanacetum coccineum]